MGAQAAAQKQPASVGTLGQSFDTSFVRAIKLLPNQKRERMTERKVKKVMARDTYNALSYLFIIYAKATSRDALCMSQ